MSSILLHLFVSALISQTPLAWRQAAPPSPTTPQADRNKSDADHIRDLIRDLGGDPARSEAAKKELRLMGRAAEPYLKEAERDPDATRAEAARGLLRDLGASTERTDQGPGEVSIVYHDWSNGVDFVRDENGRITLVVPEKSADGGKTENKTYRAESLEDFTRKYPDIAKKYHVRSLASPREASENMRRAWEHLRDAMKEEGFPEDQEGRSLETWLDREEGRLQEHRNAWSGADGAAAPEPRDKAELGVLVGAAGETLRSQLGLSDTEGVVIHAVRPKSLAERSGLKKHDVVTRLNGRPVKDVASFREEVAKALQSDHFTLDVVRGGKPQTITVRPTGEPNSPDQKSSGQKP